MNELLEKILEKIKRSPSEIKAYEDLYHICLETKKTDVSLAVKYLKALSDEIENEIRESTDEMLKSLFL